MSRRARVPRDKRIFLLRDSDRSGFKHFRQSLIKDGPYLVHPNEWDMPPPSDEPLGGEGDASPTDLRAGRFDVDQSPSVPDFQDPDENQNDTPGIVDITDGLILHYKMNDNAATSAIAATVGASAVYRDAGGENNTSNGSVAGKINTAIDFDGTDEYANVTLPTVFEDIASNDFSISLWINAGTLADQATFDRILEAFYDSDNSVQFNVDDANSITFGIKDAGTTREISAGGLSTGVWYNLVGTWDASENTVKFYINNVLQSGVVSGAWGLGDTQELRLGSRTDDAGEYDGAIDDFRLYDKVLTNLERGAIYNGGDGREI